MQASGVNIIAARTRHAGRWAGVLVFGVGVSSLAGSVAWNAGHTGIELFFAVLALFGLMSCYFAFLMTSFTTDLWLLTRRHHAFKLLPLAFAAVTYLTFAVGTGTFAWHSFERIMTFVMLPLALIVFVPRKSTGTYPLWTDWLAAALIWLPFDAGLLKQIWLWPAGSGAYILNTALAVCLVIFLFSSVRRIPDIGARLRWQRGDTKTAAFYFLGFCAVAIPIGVATDFIAFNVKTDPVKALLAPVGIFLFIAIPEELLFRGLLQNFISKRFSSEKAGLLIASILFGLTHLNNEPLMDWRYVLLATVAGVVYGAAYIRTKNLFVPAVIHAAVDAVWIQFLWKGL